MALIDSTSGKRVREYSIEQLKDAANLMRGYDLVGLKGDRGVCMAAPV